MKRVFWRRPTPSMAVALVALFCSLGGVSYGIATGSIDSRELKNNNVRSTDLRNNDVRAKDLRNNDIRGRDIRNGTITGGDVKANSLTGVDVRESSLGPVARAASAGSVDRLKTAGAFKRVASSATNVLGTAARSAATAVPLLSVGAFDLYGKCYTDSNGVADGGPAETIGEILISTRQPNSLLDSPGDDYEGNPFLNPGTAEASRVMYSAVATPNTGAGETSDNETYTAIAPDGTTLNGQADVYSKNGTLPGGDGIYGAGDACVFTADATG